MAGPLFIFCQEGHDGTVQLLLNVCTNEAVPCILLVEGDNIVQDLLENGADVNLPEHGGGTPLYIACYRGHVINTVNILPNKSSSLYPCKSNWASPLYTACQNGRESIVQLLLCHRADANICMNDGAGPLFVACQIGHKNFAETLLKNDADINLCMGNGISPLYIASQRGHENIKQLLLDRGAQVNLSNKYTTSSPLYAACFWGYCSIAQLLLNNVSHINQCLDDGSSPLIDSCFGAALDLCDNSGSGSLYRVCQFGHKNYMQILLDFY